MLPSRGILRTSQSLGLGRPASPPKISLRASTRQFGTSLRATPSSASISSRRPIAGRIGGPLALAALSARQARYASTQPAQPAPPATPSPASTPSDDLSSSLSDLFDAHGILNVPEQIGFLKGLGFDFGWGPTAGMQWIVEHIYVYSGLPWWATLAATALAIRVAIFRPSVSAQIESQKMNDMRKNPRYEALQQQFKATLGSGDHAQMMAVRKEIQKFHKAAGTRWWVVMIPMVNIPIGYGMLRLLRAMAELPVPSLETGGALWFQNLAIPDPYYILPIAAAGVFVASMKATIPYMAPTQAKTMSMMSLVIAPLSIMFTIWLPAGLQLFFFVQGGLQFFQSRIFYNSAFRRFYGLPPMVLGGARAPNASKPLWQAPRTIDTTARAAAPAEDPANLSSFRAGFGAAKEKWQDFASKNKAKANQQAVTDYETKAEMEEEARRLERAERRRLKRGGRP